MHLRFTAAEQAFREDVRAFITAHFPPARPWRGTAEDVCRWNDALRGRGWQAYKWPVEFGGTGWSLTERYLWERETASAGVPARLGGMGMMMLAPILYTYGTPDQQRRYLPGIMNNETEWCQGYSEPGAGSDLAALRTEAIRDGRNYHVTGEKIWTSYAHKADMMFALVRTGQAGGRKQEGISFLLIDMKAPGVSVRPIITIDRRHHSLNAVRFDNVVVPVENLIGEENRGWTYAKGLLTHERTGLAFVTDSLRAVSALKTHAAATQRGGQPLIHDPLFAARLARLEMDLMAIEVTELRTLAETAAGGAPGAQSSILKSRGGQIYQRLLELTVEAAGPGALTYDPALFDGLQPPDWQQDAIATYLIGRSITIAGGTEEVQRDIIARHVLGLPAGL